MGAVEAANMTNPSWIMQAVKNQKPEFSAVCSGVPGTESQRWSSQLRAAFDGSIFDGPISDGPTFDELMCNGSVCSESVFNESMFSESVFNGSILGGAIAGKNTSMHVPR